MIESIYLKNFTVFDELEMKLSPGINVIIGENGTGKTHLLKAIYTMSSEFKHHPHNEPVDTDEVKTWMTERFLQVFKPLDGKLGKLRKSGVNKQAFIRISYPNGREFDVQFHNNSRFINIPRAGVPIFSNQESMPNPVFLPAKEILSIMLGLRSIIQKYETSFDGTYDDLINLLELPERRTDTLSEKIKWSLQEIRNTLGGEFVFLGGGYVSFQSINAEYSVNVMAEGYRKLGTLYRLLETGGINPGNGAPLLWDEPDANLNPLLVKLLVQILLDLSREGQQIILATHNDLILKWIDLQATQADLEVIKFHTLYRDDVKDNKISVKSTNVYEEINPNPIDDAYAEVINRDIQKEMGNLGK